jgi:acyl-CoA thioesterase I
MSLQTEITARANTIKTFADEMISLANQIEQPPPSPLVFPPGMDCLAGTIPPPTYMQPFEQDMGYFNTKKNYPLYRLHRNTPPGSVLFYGDSILEGMAIADVTPFGANHAISGNTLRGVLTQLLDAPSIHTASAVVLLAGICDLVQDEGPIADIPLFFNRIAPWATGKWIVCHILPINESLYHPVCRDIIQHIGVLKNSHINQMNASIDSIFANRPDVTIVNATSQLAPQGQLLAAYSEDGLHPNAAGYAILKAAIKAAL